MPSFQCAAYALVFYVQFFEFCFTQTRKILGCDLAPSQTHLAEAARPDIG
jgi:hypothetical protein